MNKKIGLNITEQLPSEIHCNILSRLPADTAIQCKLVCKTWKAVLEDPSFINMHTRQLLTGSDQGNSTYAPAASPEGVLTFYVQKRSYKEGVGFYTGQGKCVEYYDYNDAGNDQGSNFKVRKQYTDVRGPNQVLMASRQNKSKFSLCRQPYATIVGSLNGLICVYSAGFQVFNSFTKEHALLPLIRPPAFAAYGFGYCPSTKEYKVACISYDRRISRRGLVQVYTLGSGTWRCKGEIAHSHELISSRGVFMSGAIYWMTNQMEMVCFSLENEEVRVIRSPMPPPPCPLFGVGNLVELGGYLCVVFVDTVTNVMEIWEMDNNTCWTKKISRLCETINESAFALSGSGKILLQNREGVISFDPKEGTSTYIYDLQDFKGSREFIPYMASFVSLDALGEEFVVREEDVVGEEVEPTPSDNKFLNYLLKNCESQRNKGILRQ